MNERLIGILKLFARMGRLNTKTLLKRGLMGHEDCNNDRLSGMLKLNSSEANCTFFK